MRTSFTYVLLLTYCWCIVVHISILIHAYLFCSCTSSWMILLTKFFLTFPKSDKNAGVVYRKTVYFLSALSKQYNLVCSAWQEPEKKYKVKALPNQMWNWIYHCYAVGAMTDCSEEGKRKEMWSQIILKWKWVSHFRSSSSLLHVSLHWCVLCVLFFHSSRNIFMHLVLFLL